MQTGTITSQCTVGGISFSAAVSQQGEGQISHVATIPAGSAGAISAAGVDGLVTGHGISVSDVIDVHWLDPADGTHKVRRGLTVDVSNANDIEFDEIPAGEGDALPAVDTAVVVSVQVIVTSAFDGDLVLMIAAKMTQLAFMDLRDAGGSELAQKFAANGLWWWATGQGFTNPIAADDITEIRISNGSIAAATFYLGILYDSAV
jgi:hypothetical protein